MTTVRAVRASITRLEVDAIVNAANVHLRHGAGLALAIANAGGPAIQEESDAWIAEHGPLTPGTAAVTTAGAMPSRYVIHVAGPVYGSGQDNAGLLGGAVHAALDAAAAHGCRSIAVPAISAGIYGYPRDEATGVIADTCREWVSAHPEGLDEILLVGYDEGTAAAFAVALGQTDT